MGVSDEPHMGGPPDTGPLWGPVSGPQPSVAVPDRRTGRRILGVLALAAAVLVYMFCLAGMAWLTDSSSGREYLEMVAPLSNVQLAVLMLGFLFCLVGSPIGLRLAKVCAAVYFLLALLIIVISISSGNGYLEFGLLLSTPGLFLLPGIALMDPRIWTSARGG